MSLSLSIQNQIATLTIDREAALNAINAEVMEGLKRFFVDHEGWTPDVRGVIITGSGSKAFAAGADIKAFTQLSAEQMESLSAFGHGVYHAIEQCEVPVIAAVNGFALGGGCELALACHIRIASDNARFGLPEITLAILPGYGGTQRMPRLIGKAKTMELALTGQMIDAPTALNLGLVNQVVPAPDLISSCSDILQKISNFSPLAVTEMIKAINLSDHSEGFENEIKAFGRLAGTQDFGEGVAAFLEKRKPEFKGR